MASEIFNRDTMLDLLVNVIPIFILGFFIVAFLVSSPFGIEPLASSIQLGLVAVPLVLLAVLTYFAARAVAGSENSGPIYLPGQASVRGAEPLEVPGEADDKTELDSGDVAPEESASEGTTGDDRDGEEPEPDTDDSGTDADATGDPAAADGSERSS